MQLERLVPMREWPRKFIQIIVVVVFVPLLVEHVTNSTRQLLSVVHGSTPQRVEVNHSSDSSSVILMAPSSRRLLYQSRIEYCYDTPINEPAKGSQ